MILFNLHWLKPVYDAKVYTALKKVRFLFDLPRFICLFGLRNRRRKQADYSKYLAEVL